MVATVEPKRSPFLVVHRALCVLPTASFVILALAWIARTAFGTEVTVSSGPPFDVESVSHSGPLDFLIWPGFIVGISGLFALPIVLVISIASLLARVRAMRWTLVYAATAVAWWLTASAFGSALA
jgi:hypothetical protein